MISIPKKRRQNSTASNLSSAHPLRQTSFPPDGADTPNLKYSRSPSIDNMSLLSASQAGGTKRKRGRKPKNNDDVASAAGGRSLTAASVKREASRGASVDEEEEEGGEDMALAVVHKTKESQRKENQDRAMLVGALDGPQMARYEIWRSSKLSDSVVRRLVNQTLSQSAPANVILAVKSVAKIFAGEIIERARKIQTQALDAAGALNIEAKAEGEDGEAGEKVKAIETRRGPLTAYHLREALRRYKKEREGNGVGLTGFWQLQQQHSGIERFGIKVGGKRLLK